MAQRKIVVQEAKKTVLKTFLHDHPECASLVLSQNDSASIASLVAEIEIDSIAPTLNSLPTPVLAEGLLRLEEDVMAKVANHLNKNLSSRIFQSWKLQGKNDRVEAILGRMESSAAKSVRKLIEYAENLVGSRMNPTPFTVASRLTAKEVLALLYMEKNRYGRFVYVVDNEFHLIGVLPFKDAFYAPEESLVSTIMTTNVTSLKADQTLRSALRHPSWQNWNTLPVTDSENRLLGVIRYDELVNVVAPKGASSEEQQELIKAGRAIGEVFQIGMTATATALGLMEDKD